MQVKTNPTDKCVFCNVDTNISRNTHIDDRQYYIEGAGQLCKECYIKVFQRS